MSRIKGTMLFFIFPWLIYSQLKTPFLTNDYQSDQDYIKELKFLKNHPDRETERIIKSIAKWAYDHKDWDTAIDNYERLLVDTPSANNYFNLAVAAARKSLEVPRFLSVPYVIKARKSALIAHELQPKEVDYLNLLIQLYAEIPELLGGSVAFAKKKADELIDIDTLAGGMMQAYIFELKNNFQASRSKIAEVFNYLKENYNDRDRWVKEFEKNLIFELGRAAAEYQIEPDLGILLLKHYQEDFVFKDNYPLEWAYYYQSKIYLYKGNKNEAIASLHKALKIKPDFKEGLEFLKKLSLE